MRIKNLETIENRHFYIFKNFNHTSRFHLFIRYTHFEKNYKMPYTAQAYQSHIQYSKNAHTS